MKRTSIALLSSAWVLAMLLVATIPVTPAQATCVEDSDCGAQTGEGMIPYTVLDNESSSDSSESSDKGGGGSESESSSGSEDR